jgi:oligoendopeptidase F
MVDSVPWGEFNFLSGIDHFKRQPKAGLLIHHRSQRRIAMKRYCWSLVLAMAWLGLEIDHAEAQMRQRAAVVRADTWKLEDLFPSDDAWEQALERTIGEFDKVAEFRGKLGQSAAALRECLQLDARITKQLDRLELYVSAKSDEDTRVAKYQGFKQNFRQAATAYGAKAAFIAPEIARLTPETVTAFVQQEPALQDYEFFLRDVLRTRTHRLPPEMEKLLAETAVMAGAPETVYSIFANAELPFPEIRLADGTSGRLNQAGFARFRASPHRADRQLVFDTFFTTFDGFRQTCGSLLSSQVDTHVFAARARHYDSSLLAVLDEKNIPEAVYQGLVDNVHCSLPTFHRYLRLRQRLLGVDQLAYSDMYAPVVKEIDRQYTYAEAKELVQQGVRPLGADYVRDMKRAFDDRWIDVYPTPGKRAGAYSSGDAYDVHPFILLNYNGQYQDVSTLAHELGHAMHSFYSNRKQPYPKAHYATFVAEVASTLNEALLLEQMLATVRDEPTRLSMLVNYLDNVRQTLFRQTSFAEFELAIHRRAEHREAITGDVLKEVYGKILKNYYGHDQGVCRIDDKSCVEWAYVPHFYRYNFYVYQYATSFTASTCLAQRIQEGRPEAVAAVMQLLSAGGSAYPIDILKRAGVDMLGPEPFDRTMAKMNRVMDEIEKILRQRKPSGQVSLNK